jgi:hypothetical protein
MGEQMKCKLLRLRGFTKQEIEQLRKLRRLHLEQKRLYASYAQRRLEFARWLVITGKLTDRFI